MTATEALEAALRAAALDQATTGPDLASRLLDALLAGGWTVEAGWRQAAAVPEGERVLCCGHARRIYVARRGAGPDWWEDTGGRAPPPRLCRPMPEPPA